MEELRTKIERRLGPWMFAASLAFLACLAAVVHAPSFAPPAKSDSLVVPGSWAWIGIAALYPLFVAEALLHWAAGSRAWRRHLWYCLLPPLRMGAKDHATGREIWLPGTGWAKIDDALRDRVERGATIPMIVVALLVLPLLAIEFLEAAHGDPRLRLLAGVGSAVIWFAFAFEFTVMISIVDHKARHCKRHWIDLAIIVLPVMQVLSGTLLGIARLGRLAKLQQLSRVARVYRLRGLLMRAWRAVLVFEVLDRILRKTPEQRVERLKRLLDEREREIAALRREIERLESAAEAPSRAANPQASEVNC